ncbi:MAG: KpsF/GutQ family sugar-phosphate isomerase [Paludibacteraceae bacterium]|jgi:arabinose-5-phosphate isomerase|nr:KpsF/GutQ family sugar-phosphate isomerase [Paludibacteraceae bacterium]MDI9536610.1 KpsF/GutQ family sugar-phosphate isomerase [Bacteroidota bacterium]HHT60753.1 KpsF/GutQ family sugar-phosphate isomerase [Bacteroidales bacterium]MBP9038751.1 KpsF/GutQ family sugar-phosphate isomerase [Paludibacteraceae bacterium]HOA46064.1 KpsF/GutQ family sugar-phosphate isomerase [Paludibacteraceae bacterium]
MDCIARSKEVFRLEMSEIAKVADRIDERINQVVDLIFHAKGKVVITGIGKTGIIGHKIASTLASTGTQSIFMNAAEALHGDLGMVSPADVVVVISNSGESTEILNIIDPVKKMGCPIVAITGNIKSSLAQKADFCLDIGIEKEASKIGLAPTTSTTAALVMGDALAVCLMEKRNFRPENFALYHPGGALGRRMLTKVKDCMTDVVPMVFETTLFKDIVCEVSIKKLGVTMVSNAKGVVTGIITDGDIRRAVQKHDEFHSLTAADFMSTNFKTIAADDMVNDALELMDLYKITTLAVVDKTKNNNIIGILHIHNIYGFRNL